MSVKVEDSGRRSVQVEVEVPGTPEEVWQAIATGPGISSWFVPSEVEEREGGSYRAVFGPGMESVGTVTAWQPPHRFAAEQPGWSPGAPPMATEWIVEARSGGTCLVRVVHSLFASGDDWDDQLTGAESGWPGFFTGLRLYLAHFAGHHGASFRLMAASDRSAAEAWKGLTDGLGLTGVGAGQRWRTPDASLPSLAGVVERLESAEPPRALLRLEAPLPGIASSTTFTMGDQVHVLIDVYLYGENAVEVVARVEPAWQGWMSEIVGSSGS